jgi:hypothetical protein
MADVQQTALTIGVTLDSGPDGEAPQQFTESPSDNTLTLKGYRTTAVIDKSGIPSMNKAQITVYGLSASLMNQLSTVGQVPTFTKKNIATVLAGTSSGSQALAFSGVIQYAWPDFSASPDVAFNITALTGLLQALTPILPSSYTGPTDVATIMSSLASQMGYTFENNGVKGVLLSSPYLPGTARSQAIAAAQAADIFLVIDDDPTSTAAGTLAIFPKDGSRNTLVPLISPDTGMVGFPYYVGPAQIGVKTEFNPGIRFGGNIQVQNSVNETANGLWRVVQLTHRLSAFQPGGDWFTEAIGNSQLARS